MIINDTHQFVFVHIPKCAGTTFRNVLRPYDQANGAFEVRTNHATLGHIDYGHIPLFILREHFREEYTKIKDYAAYAVVRDPFARFPSSLAQHFRMYQKRPIHEMKPREVHSTLEQVLRVLKDYAEPTSYLPCQYIHFQRQTDYVYDQRKCLVDKVYTTALINKMLSDVGTRIGENLVQNNGPTSSSVNQTRFYRNAWVRSLVGPVKPILKGLLPPKRWTALKQATQDWFFVSNDPNLQTIFESQYIRDFITDYYRDDLRLFEELREFENRSVPEIQTNPQKFNGAQCLHNRVGRTEEFYARHRNQSRYGRVGPGNHPSSRSQNST